MSNVSLYSFCGSGALIFSGIVLLFGSRLPPGHPGLVAASKVLPAILLGASALCFAVAVAGKLAARYWPDRLRDAADWLQRRCLATFASRGSYFVIAAGCMALVLGFDWSGYLHGFFRLDDFEYLRVARVEPGLHQLFIPHGGHAVPFYRAELFFLTSLAGPLPATFNVMNFLVHSGMLVCGCWLLLELDVGWLGLGVFSGTCWFWPGWSDFTAGYYSNSGYVQGITLGFATLAALHRHATTGRTGWLVFTLICAALAAGIGIANVWIFAALGAFAIALRPQAANSRAFLPRSLFGLTALAVLYAICLLFVYRRGEFLGPTENPTGSLLALGNSILSGIGGLVLSLVLPVQFGSLNTGGLVVGLQLAASATLAWFAIRIWPDLERRDRWILLALAATIIVQVSMVAVARRPVAVGFFWAPKWVVAARCTSALLIAWLLDRTLRSATRRPHAAASVALAGLVLGLWATAATPPLLEAMGAPVSRANSVRAALSRRMDLSRLQSELDQLAAALQQRPVRLPPCDHARFRTVFPGFEDYTLQHAICALPPGVARIERLAPLDAARFTSVVARLPSLNRLYAP